MNYKMDNSHFIIWYKCYSTRTQSANNLTDFTIRKIIIKTSHEPDLFRLFPENNFSLKTYL